MSRDHVNELGSIGLGLATSAGVGSILFEGIGALFLGILGALGGYLFHKFIKPRLDQISIKKKQDKA